MYELNLSHFELTSCNFRIELSPCCDDERYLDMIKVQVEDFIMSAMITSMMLDIPYDKSLLF